MGRLMLLLLLYKEVPLAILVFNRESRRFKAIIAIIDHVEAARILIDVLRVLLLLRCRSSREPILLRELK
jgi:myo-inositol-1-phosphate synthase